MLHACDGSGLHNPDNKVHFNAYSHEALNGLLYISLGTAMFPQFTLKFYF